MTETIVTKALDSILRARCEANFGMEPSTLVDVLERKYAIDRATARRAVTKYHRRGRA